jgi:hypothetical protein
MHQCPFAKSWSSNYKICWCVILSLFFYFKNLNCFWESRKNNCWFIYLLGKCNTMSTWANDTSTYFIVRRYKVQNAHSFLKTNNPAFADIIIGIDRIHSLPIEGELYDIETIDYHPHNDLSSDKGPAQDQTDAGTAPPSIQDGCCFFKVMIISLWNLLQYHFIVSWAIQAIDYHPHNDLSSDKGPAQDQTDAGEISGTSNSSVLLPDPNVDIRK